MSAVSITSNFVSKTQTYYPGFGIVGGSGNRYYSRGSGVIYRVEGDEAIIITNHHVVYDSGSNGKNGISQDIDIFLYGREDEKYAISAEYVGGSEYYDIAVLRARDRIFSSGFYSACLLGDEVSVGQEAIAVGNPRGYGISASLGIVSVESEYITMTSGGPATRVIRVDTAVNAGNSGGGLYDSEGKLIGIVNAKIVDESVEGIGYAIPVSVAVGVAENIIENCLGKDSASVKRAMLGVTLDSSGDSASLNEEGRIEIVETVFVSSVERGSLAQGVLEAGDVLLSATVDGRTVEITRTHHFIDVMLYASVGDELSLTIKRGGDILTKTVKITADAVSEY
jgi:serine protease Do